MRKAGRDHGKLRHKKTVTQGVTVEWPDKG